MLSYLAIFAVSLCGYAALPVWVVAAATVALASLSYAEHYRLYRRGSELGLFTLIDATLMRSLFNALCASAVAYGFGVVVRFVSAI
jgi:hypothetical protein